MPPCPPSDDRRGVALLSTLAVLTVASILLITFVTLVQTDWTATFSYGEAMKADQLAQGSLKLIVSQLQGEMAKDALPDTGNARQYPHAPVYTNVTAANLQPQLVGTNQAMPLLVKTSSTNAAFNGVLASGRLAAAPVSSTAKALNGRIVSTNRWNLVHLGSFPNNDAAPRWIVMTRSGPTNAAGMTFGATLGGSLNNPAPDNPRFAVGRIAYAIYDEGGLLDISIAGHPTSLGNGQVQTLKGSLAGADLSQLGIDADKLTKWRNAASISDYPTYVATFLSTNGSRAVYPGDTTFLSRQDLIQAAVGGVAGLNASSLTSLTTFTREKDAPSWGPAYDAADLGGGAAYPYRTAALSPVSTNRFVPLVRFARGGDVVSYHSDGSRYTYTARQGDPLLGHRFPLDRIDWLGPDGPRNGGTKENIQACFGLVWGVSSDPKFNGASVWKYVGPSPATTPLSPSIQIETLDQVAAENPPREPNFFELLQAGILNGSLGVANLKTYKNSSTVLSSGVYQAFPSLQLLRIGACIIDQYDADSCPTVIEYNQSGAAMQAIGVENLPGVTLVSPVQGVPPTVIQDLVNGAPKVTTQAYLMFNLWNPHQQPAALPQARPDLRLHVKGYFTIGSSLGDSSLSSTVAGKGYDLNLDDSIALSGAAGTGANGFTSGSTILTTSDVVAGSYGSTSAAAPAITSTPAGSWANTPPLGGNATNATKTGPSTRTDLVGYRLPDFPIASNSASTADAVWWIFGVSSAKRFNAYLEFKTPGGQWVPYQYLTGTGDQATWINNAYLSPTQNRNIAVANKNTWGIVCSPLANFATQTIAQPYTVFGQSLFSTWDTCSLLFGGGDPRSIRFNIWEYSARYYNTQGASWVENSTLWTPAFLAPGTSSKFYAGIGGDQQNGGNNTLYAAQVQYSPNLMGNLFFPAQLARNNFNANGALSTGGNSTSGGTTPGGQANPVSTAGAIYNASYQDNDGLRRIADSGIFTDTTAAVGNPFYRAADKPVILNRPFNGVAEMGYAFRDDPWRSLDFFSGKSADAGLLDLFSLHDSATVTSANLLSSVRHGTVSLNGRSPGALASLLSSTVTDTVGGASTVGKPSALASALSAFTAPGGSNGGPLVNKADLALRFVSSPLPASAFGDADEQSVKARREAIVRSLADIGQTRSWNLLIDIVAQSGQYAPTSTALDQFNVDGERRYWLHVALDRFTGEVIDEKLEPVSE